MKKLVTVLSYGMIALGLHAQDYQIPKNYTLNKTEDYAKYEPDVIKSFNWLMETPVNTQTDKRKEACAFLIKWISGSTVVTVDLKENIVNFTKSNPELLIIFMGGWSKYALETKDFSNKVNGNMAGIESVITYYTKNKGNLKKDKNIEKYIKMKEKGTLQDYVKKNS
jgi:hypothetical protein